MNSLVTSGVHAPANLRSVASAVGMSGTISVAELLRRLTAKRPFYLIAHRCNDLEEVRDMVAAGANAIECDIQYSSRPDINFAVNHDYAWKPERDAIRPYLDGVAQICRDNPRVALVMFDIKEPEYASSSPLLREIIRTHLTNVVPVNVLISVAAFDGRGFFDRITKDVRPREGYSIDEDDDPVRVSKFFVDKGVANHGFGDGTAAPGTAYDVPRAITNAIGMKWSAKVIRIVYVWTIGAMNTMRDYLRMGVDGMMVNDVAALNEVLGEEPFKSTVRLATRAENPFAPASLPAYVLTVKTRESEPAGTDANVTFELVGSAGKISTVIDSEHFGLFEAGDTNLVTLIGTDVGDIRQLNVWHDPTGNACDWFLTTIDVRESISGKVHRFDFGQWLRANRPARRTPSLVRYDLVVWTSRDTADSGTDADVKIMLQGSKGYIEKEFDGGTGIFENDSSDKLVMYGIDIGTLKAVSLVHDGSGFGDDWHVARIFVKGAGIDANVPFDRWVYEGKTVTVTL